MKNKPLYPTMSQPVIILYDVMSTVTQPWAPNIWRIRFTLNYKGLPYRTEYIELSELEKTLQRSNAPPTSRRPDGSPVYTLPVILDPRTNSILSNANVIVEYLEAAYPARPVFPDGSRALQMLFVHYIQEFLAKPLLPIMIPISHQRLSESSQLYFINPRVPPNQLSDSKREEAWTAVQLQFDFLASLLDKNADGDGVVVMGKDVTYADFVLCSILIWIQKISPHDGWVRIRSWNNNRWSLLWDRCEKYMDVC